MKLFVESFEPILYHRNGEQSHGEIGMIVSKGQLKPYANGRFTLYIHHLDVDPFSEVDLQATVNPTTGKFSTGRYSLPGGKWFLCDQPKAFVYADLGSGKIKCKATINQLHADFVSSEAQIEPSLPPEEASSVETTDGAFVLTEGDWRKIAIRLIKERRGQQAFRDALRERYGDICLITGCALLDVLEAAHIKPYRGETDQSPANGLLLRADVHTLFDLDLIGIDPNTLTVRVHPRVKETVYRKLDGAILKCDKIVPSAEALNLRWKQFQERLKRNC